jgi:hypothetical protein
MAAARRHGTVALPSKATPNNYRIDRISDAPVRNKKQTVIILILLDKFRAKKGR